MSKPIEDRDSLISFIINYNPKITRDQLEDLSFEDLKIIRTQIEIEILTKLN